MALMLFMQVSALVYNKKEVVLKPKTLQWTKRKGPNNAWVGETKGTGITIRFVLLPVPPGQYQVKPLVTGVKTANCRSLEEAKRKAQWIFDELAMDMFDF